MSTETITQHRMAFSIKELALAYGVSSGFLRLEIARGKLRPARLGRRVVISRNEAERYLSAAGGLGMHSGQACNCREERPTGVTCRGTR
jgi:hypothetical protein